MNKLLLFILVFLPLLSFSQKYTVSGIITDSLSEENLVGVVVFEKNKKIFTSCNEYGFYSLTLPKGKNQLTFSFSGYRTKTIDINLKKDTVLNISMQKLSVDLQQVIVTANSPKINTYNLPLAKISKMPVVAGETDVLKSLQLTPGVTSGNEGSASLNVRGGSPGQNLFLLDGIPVYNVNHVFGFFSVFNTDALKSVKLIKGGIPAQYYGRSSSIVDMYMKEGDMQNFHANFSIGLISSKIMLEGPVIKNKSSFLITGRRTYIDFLFRPFSKKIADNTITGYYFYDINAKWNYKFSNKNRIYLSFYTGRDKGFVKSAEDQSDTLILENNYQQDLQWGNITGALRWLSILSPKLSMNNTLFYTKFDYSFTDFYFLKEINDDGDTVSKSYTLNNDSGIEELGFKSNFDYFLSKTNKLKFGLNISQKNFNPSFKSEQFFDNSGTLDTINSLIENSSSAITAYQYSVYMQDNIKTGFFNAIVGLNANGLYVNGIFYKFFEPRINLIFNLSDKISFQTSYSSLHQYLHLLTNSSLRLPTDLWVPTTEKVKPIDAKIYDAGFKFELQNNVNIELSAFYKTFDNLTHYKQGTDFLDVKTDWQDKIDFGRGYAYGIEFLIQKTIGKFTGQIAYTYSRSFRTFEEINGGKEFPYKYDRPHNLNIQAEYHLNKKWLFTANWILMSGQNMTYSSQFEYISGFDQYNSTERYPYYSTYNNIRFPLYHRLDIAINYTHKRSKTTRLWTLGVYNVYNRLNPYYLELSPKPNTLTGVSFAPIMPFFNYSVKF